MKILPRLLLAAGFVGVFAGPAVADQAITSASSIMRKAANPRSHIVQSVPAGAEVDIQSCGRSWCYGSWRGRSGYLPSVAVAQGGPSPGAAAPAPSAFFPPPPPLAVTAPVIVAPAPVYHWGGAYFGVGGGRW